MVSFVVSNLFKRKKTKLFFFFLENGSLHMELRSEESGRANEMKMAIERLDRECFKNKKISDEQDKTINGYTAKIEEKKRELDELTECGFFNDLK